MNRPGIKLHQSWLNVLADEFDKPHMHQLKAFLQREKQQHIFYPPGNLFFNALNTTPFDKVKVVILGQDPYHGPGQAHGLSFSVPRGIQAPPSLINIFTEIRNGLGIQSPNHGDLTPWAQQGVLLLNTTLSVRANQAKSHAGQGWEQFTDRIIDELNHKRDGLAFALWGRHARNKAERINRQKHLILETSHPSPFSADYGFFGSNHFGKINDWLRSRGELEINWQIL